MNINEMYSTILKLNKKLTSNKQWENEVQLLNEKYNCENIKDLVFCASDSDLEILIYTGETIKNNK